MKKTFLVLATFLIAASTVAASKARVQALGGHVPQDPAQLAQSVQDRDEKKFLDLVQKKQMQTDVKEALRYAANNENSLYLEKLIAAQAVAKEIIQKDSEILKIALQEGTLKNIQILEKQTDIASVKFENGSNALFMALEGADLATIQYLAKNHSKLVLEKNEDGESILFAAVRRGDRKIVDEILKLKNLPKERKNNKGQSASELALSLGYKRIAEAVK